MHTLYHGDCLEVMPTLEANSVDTIITDPPYHLTAGKKGGTGEASVNLNSPAGRSRVTTGFMGKEWDGGDIAFRPDIWREALRVAKPGATLLAFGGTRTFHRLTCAIEDAGWIIRDVLSWNYGSGFPKSLDISKAIDKEAGEEREVIERRRVKGGGMEHVNRTNAATHNYRPDGYQKGENVLDITAPATEAAALWNGWGTGLKPAWEPIIMAMKPLDGTFAENALRWNVAGLAIDKGRIATDEPLLCHDGQGKNANTYGGGWKNYEQGTGRQYRSGGRWPANLLLDEDAARALDAQSGTIGASYRDGDRAINGRNQVYGKYPNRGDGWSVKGAGYPDTGGASRFFYVAKASRAERNAGLEGVNNHPTVKPLSLMRQLARLTSTPTGGVVLDPFMGSGTTGVAALQEGRSFVGIEREAEYVEIARRRIAAAELPLLREAAD